MNHPALLGRFGVEILETLPGSRSTGGVFFLPSGKNVFFHCHWNGWGESSR